jgi:hypothetical protein
MRLISPLSALAFTLLLITGCSSTPPSLQQLPRKEEPPEQTDRLNEQLARTMLLRARQAYDEGDYAKAIATLRRGGASMLEGAEPGTRLEAMKLEAFSYCLVNQVTECRAQFRKILAVFPTFELSLAERNHPLWGPALDAARRMKH